MDELRRLTLCLSESPTVAAGDHARLGTIYAEPFTGPLAMWSFSARVLDAIANLAWQPTQAADTLHVILTPALAHGATRVIEDAAHDRAVHVGLSPARWLTATPADKRRLLVETFLAQLAAVRERWALTAFPRLERDAHALIADYDQLARPAGEPAPIAIDRALARQLDLATWRAASPAARLATGRAAAERVRAEGRPLGPPALGVLPDGTHVVRARLGDVAFVLVPGGQLRRGFDAGQLARLDQIHDGLWHLGGPDARFPRTLTPFGSDATCRIDRDDVAEISPMWIAEALLPIETEPMPWEVGGEHDDLVRGAPTARWRETLDALAERRLTLPSTDELLWAASGGDARLFPWGDAPGAIRELCDGDAHAIAEAYGAEPSPHRPVPAGADPFAVFAQPSPFGLVAPLCHATWCLPDPDDATPLRTVGGALDFYPWQGGWEAMLFLTRVVSRHGFDGRVGPARAAVRPILRLSGDESQPSPRSGSSA